MALRSGVRGEPSDGVIFCVGHVLRVKVKKEFGCMWSFRVGACVRCGVRLMVRGLDLFGSRSGVKERVGDYHHGEVLGQGGAR